MTVWDAIAGSRAALGVAKQLAFREAPHAWLLLGPSGSGKRPLSVAMAAALNCPEEPGVGCGRCSTCLRILRRRHPDVHHIVPEGPLIPVDVIRENVVPEAARSPFEATRKIFIIEEADRMNPQAQNALLKTLEEPQPDTTFILISEHEQELLPTVQSRCVIIRLEPIARLELIELLAGDGASAEDAEVAARAADGDLEAARRIAFDDDSRRRRKRWLDIPRRLTTPSDALDAAAEVLDEARIAVKELEAAQRDEIKELADALGEGRGTASVRQALVKRHKRELRRLEQDILVEALQVVGSFYRDVLLLRHGNEQGVGNPDVANELRSWAESNLSDRVLVNAAQRCVDAQGGIPLNANPTLAMEAALLELARTVQPPLGAGAV
ncbi:MAG: DNA polymerase III subunit delta' [Actinobacteria bacterium]|nr:DNA polymerase III subunit delta' [Actinomycetota bacterium]